YIYTFMTGLASIFCTEIMLPSNNEESFVCCLSSMNLLYFDEWKDTDAPEVLTYFLDVVMSEFIEKSENMPFLDRANRFAKRHRALGIGVLGWHSYLQANNIAFDSFEAMQKN
ncbi:ribonucleotide-diphosphate reductase subunit alpha, partial [Glaesserella parasuis]|nr:ribonucleotide-diphosphate reductase subunit alpha [Glaesserella parasuis]